MSSRDKRLEAGRARRQRLGQEPVERPDRPDPVLEHPLPGMRYSEQQIDREAGGKRGEAPGTHATDLRNALRLHYGFSFEVRDRLLEGGSRNMLRLRLACLARRDPFAAAEVVHTWFGAELDGGVAGNRERFWGDDELLSGNYESWSTFGTLLTLKELERSDLGIDAAGLLRRDLARTQALYALLAVPGRIRNLQGRVTYEGPVVFAAGLRSIARREGNNARTPVASAVLGGGRHVGDPGPLATAIDELSDELLRSDEKNFLLALWDGQSRMGGGLWQQAVEQAQFQLRGIRTAMHFQVRVYADGTKVSMLLGPKGPSSTQEVRLVIVRGPEITDCTVVTPHAEGDERTVPASDAEVVDGRFYTWLAKNPPAAWMYGLPEGDPVLQLDTYPDRAAEWQVRA